MFFIVSTGRSGTTTIAQTLSLIDGCTCLHEPAPVLVRETSKYRYNKISHDDLAAILRQTRSPHLHGNIYCESNQVFSLIIPVLVDVFPQARYIWLIRNGLDMVASAVQKGFYTNTSERGVPYEKAPPIIQEWIDGRIQGDQCGDVPTEQWREMDDFSKICWYWAYVNRIIEQDLNSYAPTRFMVLRLEDINNSIGEVIRWMGLKATTTPQPVKVNVARKLPYHWKKWSEQECQVFEYWCGDLMDRFYPEWRANMEKWVDEKTYPQKRLRFLPTLSGKLVTRLNSLLTRNRII